MSDTNGTRRGRHPYRYCKTAEAQPGDEQYSIWSRKRLLRMDSQFQARLERAFKRGQENRAAAAQHVASPLW
jgi:hypothetical protein